MLRNEAPFAPLCVHHLFADLSNEDAAGVAAFAADLLAARGMRLFQAPLDNAAALDAVVDAALAQRMHTVALDACRLSPASAPALARLLSSDALTTLELWRMDLLDAPAAAVLAAALRANATLTSLSLNTSGVFNDAAAGVELLGALTGHASVRELDILGNGVDAAHQAAAGAALGAIVGANMPALAELKVSHCNLGDAGLRALFETLPGNTHIRTLYAERNDMSEACARDVLLPAVRANASLRKLYVGEVDGNWGGAREAAELVRRRA
jgi:hypothetical protein